MKNDKDCRVWQLTTTREAQDGFFERPKEPSKVKTGNDLTAM